jgi:hypothetical protein
MTAVNTTDESMAAALKRNSYSPDVKWNILAVAVVGDGDLYFIDPNDVLNYIEVVAFQGDFADYNMVSKPISNLKLH